MLRTTEIIEYARIPQTSVPKTVTLGIALVTAVPDKAPEAVTSVATKLQTSTLTLESQYEQRRANGGSEAQKCHFALGRAWTALTVP